VLFAVFLLFFSPYQAIAQQQKRDIKLLEGIVLTADSLQPILNAHIISKLNYWGTISDYDGKFKLYISMYDSILITSIGFRPIILYVDDTSSRNLRGFPVLMQKDTVLINEIIIRGYWDYRTFKQLIINMEPMDLGHFYEITDGINKELQFNPAYKGIKGPIQALYDRFNKNERLERKLIKNRQDYNQLMMQMGRIQDTIPAIPEHMRE
jgi:hypothetical protein